MIGFFRSGTVKQFRNGLPAFRSNAFATASMSTLQKGITAAIGAKFPTNYYLKAKLFLSQ